MIRSLIFAAAAFVGVQAHAREVVIENFTQSKRIDGDAAYLRSAVPLFEPDPAVASALFIMDDLMGDLRAHRINELSDVAGIAGSGSLGTNAGLGMPQTPALPTSPRLEGLVPSSLEGGRYSTCQIVR